jgi:thiosulfate dehydrogenase
VARSEVRSNFNLLRALLLLLTGCIGAYYIISAYQKRNAATAPSYLSVADGQSDSVWQGRGLHDIPLDTDSGKLILYGRELIVHTAHYLGPKGIVAQIANGMNCQNCHLEAGTLPFANNFGKAYAIYPQFRARNNGLQTLYDRINDCVLRSLNGHIIDSMTREMRAMHAYINWLGQDVPKGQIRKGTSIMTLKYLDIAADTSEGLKVYSGKCQQCHADKGQGVLNATGAEYVYPPLWGPHSYSDGAGLYRLSTFSGFVKNNMPFGSSYHTPGLTDKEAWDVAAFVNSQPRPHLDQRADWKIIASKPVDFPFGPYADSFTLHQHKYGPFSPIAQILKTK